MFEAHALKDLETSSGVNSSQAFSIHLTITRRGRDFRFSASVRFLIPSVDNHSSYSSETLALNGLYHDRSGTWTYFAQPLEVGTRFSLL